MNVLIGIDAGGTKTRAVAGTLDGQLITDIITDGSNVNRYGWERAQAVLGDLFASIRAQLPASASISTVFMGMAGIDREQERQKMNEWMYGQWPGISVVVEHDALSALVGATGQREGIVLISGTGSIAFGMNESGERYRVGGWGYLIGDEGSGYDIGRQALTAVMRAYDGRESATVLLRKLLQLYGFYDPQELIPLVYSESFSRERMADVARIVLESANEGDAVSLSILTRAADQLRELVETLLRRADFSKEQVLVVLTGGLLHSDSLLTELVRKRLEPGVQVSVSQRPPVAGSLLLAQQLSKEPVTQKFMQMISQIR